MKPTILILALAGLAAAQQNPPLRIPDTVEVQKDIVYARYGAREMRLDLYLPKAPAARPRPAVVYVHGGGWRGGNKQAFSRQAAHMAAAAGYVGACIEYRLSGEARWPAAIHDSKAAVRWVRANAAKYLIDPNRIGAAGGSAGGHLAALLGTTSQKEFEGDGGNPGVSSHVAAVAAFNPAVDLASFGPQVGGNANNSVAQFLGASYTANPDLWKFASPITHVAKKSAKFLFLHGDADATVPFAQSKRMLDLLTAKGVKAELFTAPGAAHGFFNSPPWFEPTLKKMQEFFLETLGR